MRTEGADGSVHGSAFEYNNMRWACSRFEFAWPTRKRRIRHSRRCSGWILIGDAHFSIEGLNETRACTVIFGPPGSLFLLGATALENFAVQPDPAAQKLRPITAVIA